MGGPCSFVGPCIIAARDLQNKPSNKWFSHKCFRLWHSTSLSLLMLEKYYLTFRLFMFYINSVRSWLRNLQGSVQNEHAR